MKFYGRVYIDQEELESWRSVALAVKACESTKGVICSKSDTRKNRGRRKKVTLVVKQVG
jgi:hypothetical protein